MSGMPERPNILFITTDMQRYDTLGCYGNPVISTPHIDALARTGVRCTHAFVNNPVCMPSRASLFTGKVPSAHGVRWNAGGLSRHEITISRRLADAGYQTAAIGKMHWGDTEADFGIEHYTITDDAGSASPGVPTYREHLRRAGHADTPLVQKHPEYHEYYGAVASPLPAEHHVDGFIGGSTVEFLRQRDRSRPFFCWTSFHGPHLPLDPAKPWDERYDPDELPLPVWADGELDGKPPEQLAFQRNDKRGNKFGDYRKITTDPAKLRRFIAHYWGKISMIDHFVGQILDELDRAGDRDNTVVIFTTDHGDFAGNHQLLFKNAFLYDDLVRVPLIISAPGRLPAGVLDAFVEEIDIPATMLSLAGVEPHRGLQGEDLLPLINGAADTWRDAVYAEAVDHRSIRTNEWKLVHYRGKPYGELYHLTEDPQELVNRYQDPACGQVREELRAKLIDRVIDLEARLHGPVPYLELEHPCSAEASLRLPFL